MINRRSIAALAVGLFVVLLAPAAHAQDAPTQLAPTMLILDASGSMAGADPAGGTKMDAAKRAVHAFVDSAPDGAPVGFATYGTSTGNSDAERAQGCQDVTVLREPGPIDKAGMRSAADGITPRGWTPMGRALQTAADHLPKEGPRSIVLVSDGDDTCAPPEPCDVARTLAGQGADLVVHGVGFGVNEVARRQLSCIAQATGGTYTDAPDAKALQRVLPRVTSAAMRNYQSTGTPIAGAATPQAAPLAAPGQHVDTIGQKERRYYAVDVPQGATAYFSATVAYPRLPGVSDLEDFNSLELRTFGSDGTDCHEYESELETMSSDGAALTVATAWEGATEQDTDNSDSCRGGGRYVFSVEWSQVSAGVPERLPVELLVGVEPAVTDPGPVAVLPEAALTEPTGPASPVVGGGSFTTAGMLKGSGRYTDTLQRSEFVFYQVRLDWGQGLAYRVRFVETPRSGFDINDISPIETRLYAPTRQRVDYQSSVYTGSESELPLTTVGVRYANRQADAVDVRQQSLAGWYTIVVQLGAARGDGPAAAVPIELDVSVTGTPESGPRYAENADTFGEGRSPAPAPAAAAGGGTTATDTAIAPVGWVVIAAVAALVLVAAALAARAARTRRR